MRGRKRLTTPAGKRKTVAYIRVSTDGQTQSGASLAAQRSRIEAFGTATDRNIDEFIVDAAESAKSLDRPGISRVIQGVKSGAVEAIVVMKLDRLTRSVRDLGDLLDLCNAYDASLISVGESLDTSSAAGRMVTNMLGVVAQWEREAIAERTSIALSQRRKERRVYSRVPFGYKRVGDGLIEDSLQQAGLHIIDEMTTNNASLRQIACRLTEARIPPSSGGRWYASSVRSIQLSRIFIERRLDGELQ